MKRPNIEELIQEGVCDISVGPGWEKQVTHFMEGLLVLGFVPTHIWSRDGVLEVHGEGPMTKKINDAIAKKANELDGRCEFCWLGGRTKAIRGRCKRHKDWFAYWQYGSPGPEQRLH